ncbi:MAG: hypothetical protein IJL86_01575, partial [Bacteroidales bacterium]|nr:hypothetical protein [Bacteroidales bacterium]
MNSRLIPIFIIIAAFALAPSCNKMDDIPAMEAASKKQKMNFDILVTRDGEIIQKGRTGVMTRSEAVDTDEKLATMDEDIPFGLIGI